VKTRQLIDKIVFKLHLCQDQAFHLPEVLEEV